MTNHDAAPRRDLDLVLVGATGFTGTLAALHLARSAPAHLRWALGGRDVGRLEALKARCAAEPGTAGAPQVLEVDLADAPGLLELTGRAQVVIAAVGPYLLHGEPLVAACAATGTDYVDLTGEPEFVDLMYLAHHDTAVASNARLVHACGFDSVPHDLGAWFTARALNADGPTGAPVVMRGVVRATGGVSGGTFHSMLNALSRLSEMREVKRRRTAAEPASPRCSVEVTGRPGRDRDLGGWLLPLPAIDQQIVARSGTALADFGPDFRYSHFAGIGRLPVLAGALVGIMAMVGAAQVPPLRRFLQGRVPAGSGPDDETRGAAGFTVDFVATAATRTVHTRVSGMDPYDLSGIALAEAALSLLLDDNPSTSGQVTTAQAMGEHLMIRLERCGVRFEVL